MAFKVKDSKAKPSVKQVAKQNNTDERIRELEEQAERLVLEKDKLMKLAQSETEEEEVEEDSNTEDRVETKSPPTINEILINHEMRLKELESAFFRLKNI